MNYVTAIKQTVEPLLAHPSQLAVIQENSERKILLGIKANPEDVGRILGRNASMIKSLQLIFRSLGIAHGQNVWISVETPMNGTSNRITQRHPKWSGTTGEDRRKAMKELEETLRLFALAVPGETSLTLRDVGNHTVFTFHSKTAMPSDLLEAFQTYAKAWGKSNGYWVSIENES